MKVLFDENIPQGMESYFFGHNCAHVISLGWAGIKNGSLMKLAQQSGFEAMLTFDSGIPHQQNLNDIPLAILILKPEGQGIKAFKALIPMILEELAVVDPGAIRVISNRTGGR